MAFVAIAAPGKDAKGGIESGGGAGDDRWAMAEIARSDGRAEGEKVPQKGGGVQQQAGLIFVIGQNDPLLTGHCQFADEWIILRVIESRENRLSTLKVDDLVQAMGLSGTSKSQVSKLCKDIDERVGALRKRPLEGDWPYLWLDATYPKVREGGRIVSVAAIIAVAANTGGRREIVGLHIGPSEAEMFWATFLKDLVRRGLRGVKLVISDAPEGLNAAIQRVIGATWQRCRVHFARIALAYAEGLPDRGGDYGVLAAGHVT